MQLSQLSRKVAILAEHQPTKSDLLPTMVGGSSAVFGRPYKALCDKGVTACLCPSHRRSPVVTSVCICDRRRVENCRRSMWSLRHVFSWSTCVRRHGSSKATGDDLIVTAG
ncbi:hypothetical protein Bbelb_001750 [Branchiostoma belcheri]|nr:hypothetical protein Bbelb_001750 [Branchiostoma belcheri]